MHIGLNAHLLAVGGGYRAAGIHNYIHYLLAYLPASSPDAWRYTALVGNANNVTYPNVQMRRSGWDTRSAVRRILWEQTAQRGELRDFDLYHALAFVAPRFMPDKVPFVVTVYDMTFMRYPERLSTARRLYLRTFTADTCRRAERIIAISQSTADDITHFLGIAPDKIDVTPLGVDMSRFYPMQSEVDVQRLAEFRQRNNLPDDFWLFLGTIEPRKNLPVLIRAYAQLPRTERLPLYIAGGAGWGMDELKAVIAETGVDDDVHLAGFVPTDDIALWYNSATAFIYPSVFEGFGLPVLEAMACGTPIITSNVSSLPEVAGHAGMTLAPHDIGAWEAGLRRAYDDGAWREQASADGLQQAQRFSPQATARLTIASYEMALANRV
jgi:glycosyltransferase involved in cell wall biosynthesis